MFIKKLRFFVNIKLWFFLRFQWKWWMKLTTNKLTWRDVSHCSDLKVRICGKSQVFVFSSISHFQITKHHLLCVNTHPPSSWAKQHKTPSLCSIGEHKKSLKSYKVGLTKKNHSKVTLVWQRNRKLASFTCQSSLWLMHVLSHKQKI